MVQYSASNKPTTNRDVVGNVLPLWHRDSSPTAAGGGGGGNNKKVYKNLCLLSVAFAFGVGLLVGILLPSLYRRDGVGVDVAAPPPNASASTAPESGAKISALRTIFVNNSYGRQRDETAPTVSFVDSKPLDADANALIADDIYWGDRVERALPRGYALADLAAWTRHVAAARAVKLERGCGRMQNRLVTFGDGTRGCVRYRQNTDQIQGELFSFYLGHLLELDNLPPSTVSVIDASDPLWSHVAKDIAAAQWNSHRPVVITAYIDGLVEATIPAPFRPDERHLNKFDVAAALPPSDETLVELAQWSDMIVFDYLTANLDRVVNNLYNYQWNVNIMEAPAHNLAKRGDGNLLVFLDNESGLLHGYRLLDKYEVYHAILLDNLCVFRERTARAIERLRRDGDVGRRLRRMFDDGNDARVKDVLPTLPDKNVKTLSERIERVHAQIVKCKATFGT